MAGIALREIPAPASSATQPEGLREKPRKITEGTLSFFDGAALSVSWTAMKSTFRPRLSVLSLIAIWIHCSKRGAV